MEKKYRVRKNSDFVRSYSKGKRFSNKDFTLMIINNNLSNPRFGYTLSRKFGKANKRNKVRRKLKEINRLNLGKFERGKDYIFIPKSHTIGLDYKTLEKSVLNILEKSKRKKR
ncbi:MAG: ribonuclease P protein component [Tissierellia bacterium]|nr:ribonuclease P protein component [Tissierellia bacterium]